MQTFKSAAFIDDSDDDEEADRLFFAKEKRLREEMQSLAEAGGHSMPQKGKQKKRKRDKGKEKEKSVEADTQMEVDGDEEDAAGSARGVDGETSDSGEDETAPSTRRGRKRKSSPVLAESEGEDLGARRRGRKRESSPILSESEESDVSREEAPKVAFRSKSVIDSDDE